MYGDGCFDAWCGRNGFIFQLEAHLDRLYRSIHALKLDRWLKMTEAEMRETIIETVHRNVVTDFYIKVLVTRGISPHPVINPRKCKEASVVIYARPTQYEVTPEKMESGIRIKVLSIRRVPHDSLEPKIKSLNYLNIVMGKLEAWDAGYDEAVMLDHQGYICECPGFNIWASAATSSSRRRTASWSGITRNSVMEMAREPGMEVEEGFYSVYDFTEADEVFMTNTVAGVAPVTNIDGWVIGDGKPGPYTRSSRRSTWAGWRTACTGRRCSRRRGKHNEGSYAHHSSVYLHPGPTPAHREARPGDRRRLRHRALGRDAPGARRRQGRPGGPTRAHARRDGYVDRSGRRRVPGAVLPTFPRKPRSHGVVQTVVAAWGGLDVLIGVAGIEPWLRGGWQGARAAAGELAAHHRHQLHRHVPDLQARRPGDAGEAAAARSSSPARPPGSTAARSDEDAYSASKAGCHGLVRIMANEYARDGIRVNCVVPGFIDTAVNAVAFENPAGIAALCANIPMRRPGHPDELAGIYAWLASDDASYTTGAFFIVDGGQTAV